MKNKSFTFNCLWFEAIKDQPDNVRLSLMDAVCRYAIDGELPAELDPIAQVAFTLIRAEIDTSARKKRRKPAADEAHAEPEAQVKPETPAVDSTATDTSAAQPTPAITDTFDSDFDEVATRFINDRDSRVWLGCKGSLYNTKLALKEFKQHIIDQGRTAEFSKRDISPETMCEMMLDAIPLNIYSKAAYKSTR